MILHAGHRTMRILACHTYLSCLLEVCQAREKLDTGNSTLKLLMVISRQALNGLIEFSSNFLDLHSSVCVLETTVLRAWAALVPLPHLPSVAGLPSIEQRSRTAALRRRHSLTILNSPSGRLAWRSGSWREVFPVPAT